MPRLSLFLKPKLNIYAVLVVLLLGFYVLFLFSPLQLTTSDLGRHLVNGQEILQKNWAVLFTNYYSYTMPQKIFINHHWLTGVVFLALAQSVSIAGLQVFHAGILLLSLHLMLRYSAKNSGWLTTLLMGLPSVLLLGVRNEVRPESFGYLFAVVTLIMISHTLKTQKLKLVTGVYLLVQQMLWVNLHLSFFLSWIVLGCGAFVLFQQAVEQKKYLPLITKLLGLWLGLITVSAINPNLGWGLLTPFTIFDDYGYPIVENKSIPFLLKVLPQPADYVYLMYAGLGALAIGWSLKQKLGLTEKFECWLAIIGLVAGWMALRNLPIAVFFALPFLANCLYRFLTQVKKQTRLQVPVASRRVFLVSLYLCFGLWLITGTYHPNVGLQKLGLGLEPNQIETGKYLQTHTLAQPIFNNYDIGSALIYWNYPSQKVFVDNRPEAYTTGFFDQTYIAMQEDEDVWQAQLQKHDFKTIVFSHKDYTSWGQQFLLRRSQDPAWKISYRDENIIIFGRLEP